MGKRAPSIKYEVRKHLEDLSEGEDKERTLPGEEGNSSQTVLRKEELAVDICGEESEGK